MATSLAARGNEVTVICRSETDYPYIDFVDGVWVHRILQEPFEKADATEYAPTPHSLLHYSGSVHREIMRIQDRRQFQIVCGPIFDFEPLVVSPRNCLSRTVFAHTTCKARATA